MFSKLLMTEKLMLTIGLFLVGALHTMIFGVFEFPSNFLIGDGIKNLTLICKLVLYSCAIITSFSHQILCRKFGLKKTLMLGLLFNLFGLVTLWLNHRIGGLVPFLILDMIFFGAALTSVINSLVTFIILKFPNRTGIGIISLFAVFNGGLMLAPLLLGFFNSLHMPEAIFPLLMALIVLSVWFVQNKLIDPTYPAHLKHLRKGTLIWTELHYRLGFFLVAIIAYAMTENSFNLGGFFLLKKSLGEAIATETISLFWLFMILGQVLLLIPLYFYSTRKIFYPLICLIIIALYFLFHQHKLFGFILGLAAGGVGCSAVFPILLSMMEKELVHVARPSYLLPYIETAVSVLVGGYMIGTGMIDLWFEVRKTLGESMEFNFLVPIGCIAVAGLLALILDLSGPNKKIKNKI